MKRLLALLFVFVMLTACGNSIDRTKPVFQTENISRIIFYGPNIRDGAEVPAEDIAEITEWLKTFTIGEKTGETLIPGSNSISFRMEYEDGTVLENGLSTITLDGTRYYMDHAPAPDSYLELMES